MPQERLEGVKRRFDFDSWREAAEAAQESAVRGLEIPPGLLPGLDPGRVREIDPGDGTRLLRLTWAPPGREDSLLVADVRECATRDAAHQVLLELLDHMQSRDVVRLPGDGPGDLAFGPAGGSAVLFARGNVAVSIRNGGAAIEPADELAAALDGWIREHRR